MFVDCSKISYKMGYKSYYSNVVAALLRWVGLVDAGYDLSDFINMSDCGIIFSWEYC